LSRPLFILVLVERFGQKMSGEDDHRPRTSSKGKSGTKTKRNASATSSGANALGETSSSNSSSSSSSNRFGDATSYAQSPFREDNITLDPDAFESFLKTLADQVERDRYNGLACMQLVDYIRRCMELRYTKRGVLPPILMWYLFGLLLKKTLSLNPEDIAHRETILQAIRYGIAHYKKFSLRAACFPASLWQQCLRLSSTETVADMDLPRDCMLLCWFRAWIVWVCKLHAHWQVMTMKHTILYLIPTYATLVDVHREWYRVATTVSMPSKPARGGKGKRSTGTASTKTDHERKEVDKTEDKQRDVDDPSVSAPKSKKRGRSEMSKACGDDAAVRPVAHRHVAEWNDMTYLDRLDQFLVPEIEALYKRNDRPPFPVEDPVVLRAESSSSSSASSASSTLSATSGLVVPAMLSLSANTPSLLVPSPIRSPVATTGVASLVLPNQFELYAQYIGVVPTFVRDPAKASLYLERVHQWIERAIASPTITTIATSATSAISASNGGKALPLSSSAGDRLPRATLDFLLMLGLYATQSQSHALAKTVRTVLTTLETHPYLLDPSSASTGYVIHGLRAQFRSIVALSHNAADIRPYLPWADHALTLVALLVAAKEHGILWKPKDKEPLLRYMYRESKSVVLEAIARLFYCRKQWDEWTALGQHLDKRSIDVSCSVLATMTMANGTEWKDPLQRLWASRREYHTIRVLKASVQLAAAAVPSSSGTVTLLSTPVVARSDVAASSSSVSSSSSASATPLSASSASASSFVRPSVPLLSDGSSTMLRMICIDELSLRQSQTTVPFSAFERLVQHTTQICKYLSSSDQAAIFPDGLPSLDWIPRVAL
jgi:hypothetical protein